MSTETADHVSVIIPARNEEENIERVVRSIASQEHLEEIVVVDDSSTDRTSDILDGLKREIPFLHALRVESLPPGWTGKTHAAAAGANAARGDWLLFTDADTVHLPGSLSALLGKANVEAAELLSISPGQETPTWWEKAVIPRVFVQLARWFPFEEISNSESPRAAANGQYMLIRRAAYERAGGFESVRGEVLEDVAFAERVKAQGGKIVFLPGARWVQTRMYRRFGEMWQGWTKNLFPLAGNSTIRLLQATARCFADSFSYVGTIALLVWLCMRGVTQGPTVEVIALLVALSPGAAFILLWQDYKREVIKLGYERNSANGYLFMAGSLMLAALLLNSWWAHRVSRRIEWKGRKYPARQVKK